MAGPGSPSDVDFGWRPYTVGQWNWVEPYGWTWASEEPWGWATYHYGRWTYVDDYGWAWVPGTTWGPAWVAFRYGDPWIGWAPLAPGADYRYDAGYDLTGLNVEVQHRGLRVDVRARAVLRRVQSALAGRDLGLQRLPARADSVVHAIRPRDRRVREPRARPRP